MPPVRILSAWFPRLGAERVIRAGAGPAGRPLAVVAEVRGALVLASLSVAAEAAGLRRGMALGDARAICPGLVTRPEDPPRAAVFRAALRRWAGRFSPRVAEDGGDGDGDGGLMLDITGCAHLFGGEAGLVAQMEAEAAGLGLSLRTGVAGTVGAAWAVARFAGVPAGPARAGDAPGDAPGDAIDQEARATRSRAQKRRWERGGPPPPVSLRPGGGRLVPSGAALAHIVPSGAELAHIVPSGAELPHIVPPGAELAHIGPLPVAALRIGPAAVEALSSLGLRRIADLAVLPRAPLAQRIGPEVVVRLDQALGRAAEPVAPARPEPVFALRLTLPEPVGREAEVLAGIDRLLAPLCDRLRAHGRGARRLRLTLIRSDGTGAVREVGLARPADRPATIRPLLALRLADLDAGPGIEVLRLAAVEVEVAQAGREETEGLSDLVSRLGARLGIDAVTRLHPADSHLPEKGDTVMAAGFSAPADRWPRPAAPRPVVLFAPEPVAARGPGTPPAAFVWRRRLARCAAAFGPERIAPEWWLDDPAWRTGARDYWRVETEEGTRLWLYRSAGAEWFAQGIFA